MRTVGPCPYARSRSWISSQRAAAVIAAGLSVVHIVSLQALPAPPRDAYTSPQRHPEEGNCVISVLDDCLAHPSAIGLIHDKYMGSDQSEERCLARSQEYFEWCANQMHQQITATYTPTGAMSVFPLDQVQHLSNDERVAIGEPNGEDHRDGEAIQGAIAGSIPGLQNGTIHYPHDAPPLRIGRIEFQVDKAGKPISLDVELLDVVLNVQYELHAECLHIASASSSVVFHGRFIAAHEEDQYGLPLWNRKIVMMLQNDGLSWPLGQYQVLVMVYDAFPDLSEEAALLATTQLVVSLNLPKFPWAVSEDDDLQSLLLRHAPQKLTLEAASEPHLGHRREHRHNLLPHLSVRISSNPAFSTISVLAEGLTLGAEYLLSFTLFGADCDGSMLSDNCSQVMVEGRELPHTFPLRLFVHTGTQQKEEESPASEEKKEVELLSEQHQEFWEVRPLAKSRHCKTLKTTCVKIRATITDTFGRAYSREPDHLASTETLVLVLSVSGLLSDLLPDIATPTFTSTSSSTPPMKNKCRRVAVLVHGQPRLGRLIGKGFLQNYVLPLNADVFIRNPRPHATQSPTYHSDNCQQLARRLVFTGINLSHFSPLDLCEDGDRKFLQTLLGDRLKSYSIDDPSHASSVKYIATQSRNFVKRELGTLSPTVARFTLLQSTRIADYFYRLSSLASLLIQEENKCEQKYEAIAIVRFDSISFESPVPSISELLLHSPYPHAERILVEEPLNGSLYFPKGLDHVVGHRSPMLYLAFNLVWSCGSLLWDMEVPPPWRQQDDSPETWKRFSSISFLEGPWSLFLHRNAQRLKISFFGLSRHIYLTPFVNQRILVVTPVKGGEGEDKKGPGGEEHGFQEHQRREYQAKRHHIENVPKLYAQTFCNRPCSQDSLLVNTEPIIQPNMIWVQNVVRGQVSSPSEGTTRWIVKFVAGPRTVQDLSEPQRCLRRWVLLLCGIDSELARCVDLYLDGHARRSPLRQGIIDVNVALIAQYSDDSGTTCYDKKNADNIFYSIKLQFPVGFQTKFFAVFLYGEEDVRTEGEEEVAVATDRLMMISNEFGENDEGFYW